MAPRIEAGASPLRGRWRRSARSISRRCSARRRRNDPPSLLLGVLVRRIGRLPVRLEGFRAPLAFAPLHQDLDLLLGLVQAGAAEAGKADPLFEEPQGVVQGEIA